MRFALRVRALFTFVAISICAGLLVAVAAAPVAAATGVSASSVVQFFRGLPSYLQIGTPQQASTIYANQNGKQVPIASFFSENRDVVPGSKISPLLKKAAVDTEDPRFYQEGGIDIPGTLRAAIADSTGGGRLQGGSSITQQYVKNVLVQQCEQLDTTAQVNACYQKVSGTTIARKLQELRYSIAVNKQYSKSTILNGYLNIVGMGGNVYGVQAASQYYFGVNASDVSLPQAATLVAILNNPSNLRIDEPGNKYNGSANGYKLTLDRRNYVIQRMYVHHSITKAQETQAIATPIAPKITPASSGCSAAATNYDAGYFCEYVRAEVLHDSAFGATTSARAQALDTQGLKIYTTLDLALQAQAQADLSRYVPATMSGVDIGGSDVTVQPGTGHILAMVQNTAYSQSDQAPAGSTAVNYSADEGYGGSIGFQTGSTFKAFTLAEWLATGHTLSEYVTSNQHSYPFSQFQNSCENIGNSVWNVANDVGFSGNYTVLRATAESINTVFAQMGKQLDLCKIADLAKAMGIHRADGKPLTEFPSMILGVNELSPLNLASAYAGFANGGVMCTPVGITSVTTASGKSIAPTPSKCSRGVPANVAATVDYALQSVLSGYGTAATANPQDSTPKFAKTGTTDSDVQNWLVTSTTKYTNATWVGNASGTVPLGNRSLLGGTTGYNAKFSVDRALLSWLDTHYGGGALPTPDQAMIGTPVVTTPTPTATPSTGTTPTAPATTNSTSGTASTGGQSTGGTTTSGTAGGTSGGASAGGTPSAPATQGPAAPASGG
ncbi:transglycosylase domain-containing protein [Curtobacterium ammoniigenes]|uniref:transglycosylase domain-containing protein n=1 Tax=Curtobacterium ammoniigenes TaxID=395387 RepID=UPI0008315388|nr:transglycosylase domain-containing protein [Curtobacterium ammoniigenes]